MNVNKELYCTFKNIIQANYNNDKDK
jgi:hypothetical protein